MLLGRVMQKRVLGHNYGHSGQNKPAPSLDQGLHCPQIESFITKEYLTLILLNNLISRTHF